MKIPFLDLRPQFEAVRDEIKAAVCEVIDSGQFILGPKVEELETEMAKFVGVDHAVGVSSGTDALLLTLMALGVGPGDLVVTTPYSFFATAGVVARLNATPVFVDIASDSFAMDAESLRKSADTNTDNVWRAVLPVHLYGQCADMDPINSIAKRCKVPVVEDAAQSIGAQYPSENGSKKAGGMGLAGCFSFYPTKNLSAIGEAGLVTTNDTDFADRLRKLRNHGMEERYYHAAVGGNFRMDAVQAAALLVRAKRLDEWNAERREIAAYYDAHLQVEGLRCPPLMYTRQDHVYHQYVITVSERRDGCRAYLNEKGVGTEVYYPVPFHLQECFASLGYTHGDFPNSEHAADHTLALPIYPGFTRDMQDYVIEQIAAFYA